jgi:hypothetical protein
MRARAVHLEFKFSFKKGAHDIITLFGKNVSTENCQLKNKFHVWCERKVPRLFFNSERLFNRSGKQASIMYVFGDSD